MKGPLFVRLHEAISAECNRRKKVNAAYSLRAFGRDLGVSPAVLSCFLSRKRNLSRRNAVKIATALNLVREPDIFQVGDANEGDPAAEYLQLTEKEQERLSDWVTYAVLSLARLQDAKASSSWLARKLGITQDRAKKALQLLLNSKLVTDVSGQLVRTAKPLTSTFDQPSLALRRLHNQYLDLAKTSLMRDPVQERDFGTTTLLIDPKNLPRAKRELLRFRRKLSQMLSEGEPTRVFAVSAQIFELKGTEG